MPETIIVVPVFNHSKTLRDVVERILEVHTPVLVVDDGSTDPGIHVLENLDVLIVRHSENRGKGAALMSAAAEARSLGMTHMVTMDADGQHDPSDLPAFLEKVENCPRAIIVGKRDFESIRVPPGRRFGRAFSNFWLRVQTGRAVGDAQCGFRAYPLDVLEALKIREKRFAFEIEVLAKAAWAGIDILDVDISTYYPPKAQHISHFRMFMDNLRLTRLNTLLTTRSMLPWPHQKIFPSYEREGVTLLHPVRSLRILLAVEDSPGRLAAAGALGVFLGALPLIACHLVTILFATGYLRLNKIAALGTCQLCTPPFVPAICIEAGYFMRHGSFLTDISLETLGYQCLERIWEWFLGSLVVGPVLALIIAGVIFSAALLLKSGR